MENRRGTEEKEKVINLYKRKRRKPTVFVLTDQHIVLHRGKPRSPPRKRLLLTEERIPHLQRLGEPLSTLESYTQIYLQIKLSSPTLHPQPSLTQSRTLDSANLKIRIPKKNTFIPYYQKILLVLLLAYYQTLKIEANEKRFENRSYHRRSNYHSDAPSSFRLPR